MNEDYKTPNIPITHIDSSEIKNDFSQILYNQSQTIFELTNEINKKDSIIKQLSNNQSSISEAILAQVATYKKELNLLQTKMSMTTSEYEHQLQSQEETIQSHQSQLRQLNDTLSLRDRKLNELLSIVNEYDNQSSSQIKKINQLEKTNKELRSVINDMSANYHKVSLKFNNKKEEAKNTFDSVYEIQLEKEELEQKAKELVDIIKEYSIELSKLKTTNTLLIEQNDNLKRENEEMVQLNYELDQRYKGINDDYCILKEENSSLINKINQYEKMVDMISNNNKKLQLNNEQINGLIQKKDAEIYQTENMTQDFSLKVNNDLISIANWINTYLLLPSVNDSDSNKTSLSPEITLESNHSAFELIIKALHSAREKNNEERDNLSNKIVNLTRDLEERYKENDRIENVLKEIKEDKEQLRLIKDENDILKNENRTHDHKSKRYQEIINELNDNIAFLNSKNNLVVNENVTELIMQMIKEVNEKKILGDKKRFASIAIDDQQNDINELVVMLIDQFKEVISLDDRGCDNCLQLKNEYKAIEKKYNALLTDIELKQIQIQKQEEMINRRQLDKEIIKKLQIEKEQLLQDNITLIEQNALLKRQIEI